MTSLADPVDSSARPAEDRTGPVTISRELFDFLMGVGGIDGLHFGEHQPDKIGAFWWRRNLRAADVGAAADVLVGDIDAAIAPIRHWYDSVEHELRPLVDVVTDMVFDIKADRQLLTSMHAALRAADEADRRREHCQECSSLLVEYEAGCSHCSAAFARAYELRRAAMAALDGNANRYLAMLELSGTG